MDQDLLGRAKDVVRQARRLGAAGVRVSLGRTRESMVEWRDGELERLRESTRMTLEVHLYVQDRYSLNATSDLRPDALGRFLEDTLAATRVLAPDPHRRLPDPARFADRFAGDLGLFDPTVREVDAPTRRRAARALEEAARAGSEAARIVSVETSCRDRWTESALCTSNGMEGIREASVFDLFAQTSVRDQGDRKPEGAWSVSRRLRADLPPCEQVGAEATRRALQDLGGRPEKSGEYPCVIEAHLVPVVLMGFVEALDGALIQQRSSFLSARIGQPVTAELLSITDDPHLVGGLGSRTYDLEGMASRPLPLVEKGALRNFYLDTTYASRLGRPATSGAPSNLVFNPGQRELAGMLAAMGDGVLITGFTGGNSNPATGDFSIGLRGQWIRAGKPDHPLSEMNLSSNHATFWHQLVEIGGTPDPNQIARAPALRFKTALFSGT